MSIQSSRTRNDGLAATSTPYVDGFLIAVPRAVQASEDETVIFSWIAYESRDARDAIDATVWPIRGSRTTGTTGAD